MAVPYHTHTFEIPTATKQDMAARAANDKAVTPSVLGTAATADISQFATAEQGKKADSAVQPQNLKNLAYKDKITVNEINTNGAPSNTTFLSGNGWQNLTGGGDMTVAIYDPQNKRTDAFDMANMNEADNAKVMTADERNRIANLDNTYLSKAGGTITDSLEVTGGIDANVLTVQGKARIWETGDITGSLWQNGNLYRHIESRCSAFAGDSRNWCVTDSRVAGWAEIQVGQSWSHLPSGFFATSLALNTYGTTNYFGGHQPQLYIANRGWFALGGW